MKCGCGRASDANGSVNASTHDSPGTTTSSSCSNTLRESMSYTSAFAVNRRSP